VCCFQRGVVGGGGGGGGEFMQSAQNEFSALNAINALHMRLYVSHIIILVIHVGKL